MLMWASRRVVVVLPLVPVTEATGMRGVTSRGPSPSGEAAATPAARSATASANGRPASRSPSTSPMAAPSASARARCRQTKAHTTTSVSLAARVRTPSRRVPTSAASARATRSTSRSSTCWRCSDPARPAGRGAARVAVEIARNVVVRGVEVAGQRQGHLDGRAREVEVRPLEDAHLAGGDAGPGLVARVSAGSLLTRGA